MDVLLIVDLQNDFLPGGSLAVPNSDKIIPVINALISKFPLVVASQDWHPREHISFASTHHAKTGAIIGGQKLWPDHCVQDTHGAALSSALNRKNIKKIFKKGTHKESDSYSAFFNDCDRNEPTELNQFLKNENVNKIFIVGLVLEYCVASTALDASHLGYEVILLEEGIAALGSDQEKRVFFKQLESQNICKSSVNSFI